MNLNNLLHEAVARHPHKTALVQGGGPDVHKKVSYEQLAQSATILARRLLQNGCQPGDRIAIHWTNAVEVVTIFFACFQAGLIAVPVNVRMKAAEIAYVLGHSKSVLCFSEPALAPLAQEASANCPGLRGVHTSLSELPSDSTPTSLPEIPSDQVALILYTSGTTARPKGVTHTHRTLLGTARLMAGVAPESFDSVLVMTQMMHTSGINCDLLPALLKGGTAVLVPAFNAALVLDLMERYGCTYTMGLPSLVQFLIEEQVRQPRQIHSLRTFIAGGDSVPVAMQERFQQLFGIPLREAFGMTESLPSLFNPADAIRPGSLGRVVEGAEVRIIDGNGRNLGDNQIGEIIVRSPANCIGYWDDLAATSETVRDGWLHTGDLGRRDEDGYHWFEGRKKEIIVHGGSNISPQEVEEALYSHPAVLEAAVIGIPDAAYGEKVIAFVSLREAMTATGAELMDHARRALADYKVPEQIFFIAELPKGITGKIQRRVLKQMATA